MFVGVICTDLCRMFFWFILYPSRYCPLQPEIMFWCVAYSFMYSRFYFFYVQWSIASKQMNKQTNKMLTKLPTASWCIVHFGTAAVFTGVPKWTRFTIQGVLFILTLLFCSQILQSEHALLSMVYCSLWSCCFVYGCSKVNTICCPWCIFHFAFDIAVLVWSVPNWTQLYCPQCIVHFDIIALSTGDPSWTRRCHPCLVFTPPPVSNWQFVDHNQSESLCPVSDVCFCDQSVHCHFRSSSSSSLFAQTGTSVAAAYAAGSLWGWRSFSTVMQL